MLPSRLSLCLMTGLLLTLPAVLPAQQEHPLAPAIRIAKVSLQAAEALKDYEATFSSQEMVGQKVFTHNAQVKIRHQPFSVYMGFMAPNEGREVLYVDGQNENKLLAHDSGIKSIVGTVALDPNSRQAMSESRHPVTNIGMKNLVAKMITVWEGETKYGESDVKYYPNAKLGNMDCKVIENTHPVPRRQFNYHITRLYIDKATNLPVRVEHYAFPQEQGGQPVLIEQYTYTNIRPNAGLDNTAFDTRNPAYRF